MHHFWLQIKFKSFLNHVTVLKVIFGKVRLLINLLLLKLKNKKEAVLDQHFKTQLANFQFKSVHNGMCLFHHVDDNFLWVGPKHSYRVKRRSRNFYSLTHRA